MPEENVELVRRFFDAFENDRDVLQEVLHHDVEWRPFEEGHSPSFGIEGGLRIRDQWMETWESHHIELEDVVSRGEDVVASAHITARGRGSGVEVDVHLYGHIKIRDGKVAYIYEHESREEALRAAGYPAEMSGPGGAGGASGSA